MLHTIHTALADALPPTMTVDDAAAFLGISRSTAYALSKSGGDVRGAGSVWVRSPLLGAAAGTKLEAPNGLDLRDGGEVDRLRWLRRGCRSGRVVAAATCAARRGPRLWSTA